MAGYNPVKTGYDPRSDKVEMGNWLNIKPNEVVDATILVEAADIISVDQCAIWLEDGNSPVWVYTGPEDPSHALGVDKRYRAYLPLLVDGEPRVWSMGKQAHGSILEISDASGSIKGFVIRIKRTGAGLKTRYSIVPKGKREDVSEVDEVDVIAMLGPTETSEIEVMLAKRFGYGSYEEFVTNYKVGGGKSKAKAKTDDVEELDLK